MAITINGNGTLTGITDYPNSSVGQILQVVSATKTDKFATNSTSYVDVTGLNVSITPSSTSSKILVIVNLAASSYTGTGGQWIIARNSTALAVNTHTNATQKATGSTYSGEGNNGYQCLFLNMTHLDSPSTTSATTYKVQIKHNASNTYLTVNSRSLDDYVGAVSSITAMEVAG